MTTTAHDECPNLPGLKRHNQSERWILVIDRTFQQELRSGKNRLQLSWQNRRVGDPNEFLLIQLVVAHKELNQSFASLFLAERHYTTLNNGKVKRETLRTKLTFIVGNFLMPFKSFSLNSSSSSLNCASLSLNKNFQPLGLSTRQISNLSSLVKTISFK